MRCTPVRSVGQGSAAWQAGLPLSSSWQGLR
jgi:hypothetical protein